MALLSFRTIRAQASPPANAFRSQNACAFLSHLTFLLLSFGHSFCPFHSCVSFIRSPAMSHSLCCDCRSGVWVMKQEVCNASTLPSSFRLSPQLSPVKWGLIFLINFLTPQNHRRRLLEQHRAVYVWI